MMSVLALERNTLKITLVMSSALLSLGFFRQKLLLQTGRHLDSMQTFSKQQGSSEKMQLSLIRDLRDFCHT